MTESSNNFQAVILDLVCTTNPDLITSVTTAGGMSDHDIVMSIVYNYESQHK